MPTGGRRYLSIAGAVALGVLLLMGLTRAQPFAPNDQLAYFGRTLVAAVGLAPASAQSGKPAANAGARSVCYGPETAAGFRECQFTDADGQKMNFLLYTPVSQDRQRKYPLVLVLHGGGERAKPGMTPQASHALLAGASYVKIWGLGATGTDAPGIQARWPSFVVVPQLTYPDRWVDVPPAHGSYALAAKPTVELRLAKEIVDEVQREYGGVDADRRYITGISLGGYGTWDAIERWPRYFAAAVPVAGAGDPAKAYVLKDLPIWAFHGAADPIVPVSGSRDMVAAIRAAGGQPRYTEYADAEHAIWPQVYALDERGQTSDVFAWLFAQRLPTASNPH